MFKTAFHFVMDNFPRWGIGVSKVWLRNWLHFRYTFLVTIFWIIIEPLFYLLAIGYGLGGFITQIGGKSYAEFYFPALLCTTAMMVPFFESTYGNYTKLTWQKTYSTMLFTPIGVDEIFLGEVLWATTKGFFSVLGVTVVSLAFNIFDTWLILPGFLILTLVSFTFAVLGMLFTTFARNYDSFIYTTSGLIIPFSLFSDTYFPISNLPAVIRGLAYLSPLTHGVIALRSLLSGEFGVTIAFHLGVLLLISFVLLLFAKKRFTNKLMF